MLGYSKATNAQTNGGNTKNFRKTTREKYLNSELDAMRLVPIQTICGTIHKIYMTALWRLTFNKKISESLIPENCW